MNNEPTDAEYRASLDRAMATDDLLARLRESEARVERLTAALELTRHKIEQTLDGQYPEGQALRAALRVATDALAKEAE